MQFNGDTGSNYAYHRLNGNGSSAAAEGFANVTLIEAGYGEIGGGGLANTMGVSVIDIHDYASTTRNKTVRSFSGTDQNNTNGIVGLASGLWRSTSAISTLTIKGYNNGTDPFVTYSSFALYGVK